MRRMPPRSEEPRPLRHSGLPVPPLPSQPPPLPLPSGRRPGRASPAPSRVTPEPCVALWGEEMPILCLGLLSKRKRLERALDPGGRAEGGR